MTIKNRFTGKTILEIESLYMADLSGADLSGANLYMADLSGANLYRANLSGANLSWANLSGADLSGANLYMADLSGANLSWANLYMADLSGADLSWANLSGADLSWANLREVKSDEHTTFFDLQCPEDGSFTAWKKCKNNVIVKLLIPEDARRSSATSRKCRASKAVVLDVMGAEYGVSLHDSNFTYRKGETVEVSDFDECRWNECSSGIHFFLTRQEAENYNI